ncbi:Golgi transport complex subunit 3 [Naganishia albida]|nr:Golgi transport complex subunit 3 [Naganishia albida]
MDQSDYFQYSRPSTPSAGRRQVQTSSPKPVVTPLPAKTVSLAEWEANTPLNQTELASLAIVKEACGTRSLPAPLLETIEAGPSTSKFSGVPISRKGPQALLQSARRGSRPGSALGSRTGSSSTLASTSDLYDQPATIATAQQFHEHFSHLTSSLLHSQDSLYRSHLAEISGYKEACDVLDQELKDSEEMVRGMIECLNWVEEKGESLRVAGEGLMQEEVQLKIQTQELAARLEYFTFLEQAQRMLNYPGDNLVLSEGFLSMVERLDGCLQYLRANQDFKDADVYLIRYQQCMTRSMTLIKMYFVNAVRALGGEVYKKVNDRFELSETAVMALLYTKFTSFAFPLRPLLSELELRAKNNQEELGTLLEDCHHAWIGVRRHLINPAVEKEIKRMEPTKMPLVDLTRAGCTYLKQVCTEEFNLFKQFFRTGEKQLYAFFESLCDHLYQYLRPRIANEQDLQTLCEVCTVLQALMVKDIELEDTMDFDYSPDIDERKESYFPPAGSTLMERTMSYEPESRIQPHRPMQKLHTAKLLEMILRDTQSRLVYRSQAIIKNDVSGYYPKGDDLDYPAKIESVAAHLFADRERMAQSLNLDDDEPAFLALPSKETQETWYPTLRTTLWILSCLHTYVEDAVFDGMAETVIGACRKSLLAAARSLSRSSPAHAQFFLIRHLLILKEMTASVDLIARRRNDDSGGVIQTLSSLLSGALSFVGVGGLLGLNTNGKVTRPDELVTAKIEVDRELKRVCEEAIEWCRDRATENIRAFTDRAVRYVSAKRSSTTAPDLSSQAWATSDTVKAIAARFEQGCQETVGSWISNLKLYLQDEATVRVLLPPLQTHILDVYKPFYDLVRSEYEPSIASALISPPTLVALLRKTEAEALAKELSTKSVIQ